MRRPQRQGQTRRQAETQSAGLSNDKENTHTMKPSELAKFLRGLGCDEQRYFFGKPVPASPISRTSDTPNHSPRTAVHRHTSSERGTALVEFALILPLLALVAFGTVDLGRAYTTVNQVKNAAREGAAYAQTRPARLAGTACITPDSAQWFARNEAGSAGADFAVEVSAPAGRFTSSDAGCAPFSAAATSGEDVTVTVSTPFTVLTPLVRAVTGDPTIRSSVTVRVP